MSRKARQGRKGMGPRFSAFCLLLYFGEVRLKHGIERIVNGLPDEKRQYFLCDLRGFCVRPFSN